MRRPYPTVYYLRRCDNTACRVETYRWFAIGETCPGCAWIGVTVSGPHDV